MAMPTTAQGGRKTPTGPRIPALITLPTRGSIKYSGSYPARIRSISADFKTPWVHIETMDGTRFIITRDDLKEATNNRHDYPHPGDNLNVVLREKHCNLIMTQEEYDAFLGYKLFQRRIEQDAREEVQ